MTAIPQQVVTDMPEHYHTILASILDPNRGERFWVQRGRKCLEQAKLEPGNILEIARGVFYLLQPFPCRPEREPTSVDLTLTFVNSSICNRIVVFSPNGARRYWEQDSNVRYTRTFDVVNSLQERHDFIAMLVAEWWERDQRVIMELQRQQAWMEQGRLRVAAFAAKIIALREHDKKEAEGQASSAKEPRGDDQKSPEHSEDALEESVEDTEDGGPGDMYEDPSEVAAWVQGQT